MLWVVALTVIHEVALSVNVKIGRNDLMAKLEKVKMKRPELVKVQQLHNGWHVQAVSALLGALAKEQYQKMNRHNRKALIACLDSIKGEHDVRAGSRCLVKAYDEKLIQSYSHRTQDVRYDFVDKDNHMKSNRRRNIKSKSSNHFWSSRTDDVEELKAAEISKPPKQNKRKTTNFDAPAMGVKHDDGSRRDRIRRITSRRAKIHSKLKSQLGFGDFVAMEKIRAENRRLRRSILSLYTTNEAKAHAKLIDQRDGEPEEITPLTMNSMPRLPSEEKSPVKVITSLLTSIVNFLRGRGDSDSPKLAESYKKLGELQEFVFTKRENEKFKYRMLDMVLGRDNPLRQTKSASDRLRDLMPNKLVDKSVYELVDSVDRATNGSINGNILSPRFLPLMPSKNQHVSSLSPNLFPLYHDETGKSVLPIPDILDAVSLTKDERKDILELIVNAAGIDDVVEDSMNSMKDLDAVTDLISSAFGRLSGSMSDKQRDELESRKYTFMTKKQYDIVYGENGIYNITESDFPFDINQFDEMSDEEKAMSLRNTVRLIAEEKPHPGRQRRQTQTDRGEFPGTERVSYEVGPFHIVIGQHTILSPFAFSPVINEVAIVGLIFLSPSIFSPLISSPLLMAHPIMSPIVAVPLIFSPFVLGPNIFSPGVWAPYVFSPYVVSPNIFNPFLMSPLVFCPRVISPDIFSSTILSGSILSPTVLSPSVFSEAYLNVEVLSPTFLS